MRLNDSSAFGALGQRLQTLQAMSLIESRRQRDLRVLLDWGQQIDGLIRWEKTPPEGTLQYKEWGAFMMARLALDSKLPISTPKKVPSCSLELAIHLIENEYLTQFNKLPINEEYAKLKQVYDKYGGGKVDITKLSPSDREIYDSIRINTMGPADKLSDAIKHYEMLKIFAATSELIYNSDSVDLMHSAGDLAAIGETISDAASHNALSEQQTIAIGVWRMLDGQMPSELAEAYKEFKSRLDAAKGAGAK